MTLPPWESLECRLLPPDQCGRITFRLRCPHAMKRRHLLSALALPGLPVGSPGLENGSGRDAYDVRLIDRNRRDSVFVRYAGA